MIYDLQLRMLQWQSTRLHFKNKPAWTMSITKQTMNNEILYILLPDFAEHEMVYLAQAVASDEFALKESPKYVNKIVAPTLDPVKSIGGFRMLPD